jgi:acetyl-CoA C-acetyltransferase
VDLQAWADEQVDGEKSDANLLLTVDEGVRPGTNIEELAKLKPAGAEGSIVTAGNASQRSDGASACVIMEETLAEKKGLAPLGRYIGTAVSGLEPDEMGIGPAVAIPRLLQRFGVTPDQVGLWEINESFAAPVLHCRDVLQIPDERLNVNGGAISLGHPYGMSGARIAAHALLEGRRRKARYVVASASVGGGIGAACLLEVL